MRGDLVRRCDPVAGGSIETIVPPFTAGDRRSGAREATAATTAATPTRGRAPAASALYPRIENEPERGRRLLDEPRRGGLAILALLRHRSREDVVDRRRQPGPPVLAGRRLLVEMGVDDATSRHAGERDGAREASKSRQPSA